MYDLMLHLVVKVTVLIALQTIMLVKHNTIMSLCLSLLRHVAHVSVTVYLKRIQKSNNKPLLIN